MIGVILIGLPLLALGVDRALPPPRRRPNPPTREPAEIVRKEFGLAWQDQLEVVAAVQQGRAAGRLELRPATRRLAELVLSPPHPTLRGRPISEYPQWQRTTARLVFAALVLIYVTVVIARGGVGLVGFYAVYLVLTLAGTEVVRRRRHRRAVEAISANP